MSSSQKQHKYSEQKTFKSQERDAFSGSLCMARSPSSVTIFNGTLARYPIKINDSDVAL